MTPTPPATPVLAVVRIRGSSQTRTTVERALHELHLTRKFHVTLVPANETTRGTLHKVKDYVAWGGVDAALVQTLLEKRGETRTGKRFSADALKGTPYANPADLAKALASGAAVLGKLAFLKPVFRLSPPRKGLRGAKKPRPKGALGNWGADIAGLLQRMV